MTDADRHHLLNVYKPPKFKYGNTVRCEVRGAVVVVGLSDAPVPWPVGIHGRAKSLVVFKGLAEAVRRESASAVCYWWGVSAQTVSKWRGELGVGQMTEGTSLLKSEALRDSEPLAARERGRVTARDPDRVRKIRDSRLGKARPAHVIDAMREANLGRKHSEETRRKLSEARKGRARAPRRCWSPGEDALLGELSDAEVARRTGRSVDSVGARRRKRGRGPADW